MNRWCRDGMTASNYCQWHPNHFGSSKMICNKQYKDPLTAVTVISVTILSHYPCLYRGFLCVWCHKWPHTGRGWCSKLHSLLLVSFVYPDESNDQCLFWRTMIGQNSSHDLNILPCSFQLHCLHQVVLCFRKTRIFFNRNTNFLYNRTDFFSKHKLSPVQLTWLHPV